MANYSNITTATNAGKTGGFKPVLFFSPLSDITTLNYPTGAGTTPGDTVEIKTAHVWAATKAATRWEAKLHSVKTVGAPVGDEGSQEIEYTTTVVVLGDNPVMLEQIQKMMNDQIIIWTKDADCKAVDSYVQLGDDCVPVTVSPAFDSGTTKEGQKMWTFEFKSKRRYFYNATMDVTI